MANEVIRFSADRAICIVEDLDGYGPSKFRCPDGDDVQDLPEGATLTAEEIGLLDQ